MRTPILLFIFSSLASTTFGQSELAVLKIDSIRVLMKDLAAKNELSKVSEFYTSNAVVNGFDVSLEGIEEIKAYWKNLKGEGVSWKWKNIQYSGTDEYVNQTGISLLTLKYGEREITYSSNFSVIWKKNRDGNYKIISDFYRNYYNPVSKTKEFSRDSVYITVGKDSIFGLLFLPKIDQTKKVPAVLLLQGGGDVGLSNYLYEARFFAENGIAALICDKAGAGLSKGESSWITQTFEEKSKEYFQLIKWLKQQKNIEPGKVGIHGLSEGGRLALDIAIKNPEEIAFVNAVSAPLESFKQNQLFAIYNLLIPRNFDYTIILETLSIWDQYFDEIAEGDISEETIEKANNLRGRVAGLYLPPDSRDLPQRPQSNDIHYSIKKGINDITSPVLFQYGQEDTRVNSTKSISILQEKGNFDISYYENTDHSMNLPNGLINLNYLKDKENWLEKIGITGE